MKNQTVVVTSVTSFLGAHVARAFAAEGWTVIGTYHRPIDEVDALRRSRWNLVRRSLVRAIRLDMLDDVAVRALIRETHPSVWVHQTGIGRDFASDDYNLAAANTLHLRPLDTIFPAIGNVGGSVILTGSGMEYGASAQPSREDAPCRPDSPYGLSRLAATLRARQLAQRFGVPTRVARVFTLFGETDAEGRLVGRLVARLRDGQSVGIAPATSRDICDVADVAAGYVALAFNAARGPLFEIFNLSRGAAMPLTEFAHIVAARLGADSKLIKEDSAMVRRNEGAALAGDNLKAHLLLGWAPQDLETGIYRLIREFDLVTN